MLESKYGDDLVIEVSRHLNNQDWLNMCCVSRNIHSLIANQTLQRQNDLYNHYIRLYNSSDILRKVSKSKNLELVKMIYSKRGVVIDNEELYSAAEVSILKNNNRVAIWILERYSCFRDNPWSLTDTQMSNLMTLAMINENPEIEKWFDDRGVIPDDNAINHNSLINTHMWISDYNKRMTTDICSKELNKFLLMLDTH